MIVKVLARLYRRTIKHSLVLKQKHLIIEICQQPRRIFGEKRDITISHPNPSSGGEKEIRVQNWQRLHPSGTIRLETARHFGTRNENQPLITISLIPQFGENRRNAEPYVQR
jgi:hypothetical protein